MPHSTSLKAKRTNLLKFVALWLLCIAEIVPATNYTIADSEACQNGECLVNAEVKWIKLIHYFNNSTSEATVLLNWIVGLQEQTRNHHPKTQPPQLSSNQQRSTKNSLEITSIEVFLKQKSSAPEKHTIKSREINGPKPFNAEVKVPSKSRYVGWQLAATVNGYEVGFNYIIGTDGEDDEDSQRNNLEDSQAIAKVLLPAEIKFDKTPVRIKHRNRNRFLTQVLYEGMPKAVLAPFSVSYFILSKHGDAVRIKALNSTKSAHDCLYSEIDGRIFFDKEYDSERQLWTISARAKQGSDAIRSGDAVSFRSKFWPDSVLLYDSDRDEVGCKRRNDEDWILLA